MLDYSIDSSNNPIPSNNVAENISYDKFDNNLDNLITNIKTGLSNFNQNSENLKNFDSFDENEKKEVNIQLEEKKEEEFKIITENNGNDNEKVPNNIVIQIENEGPKNNIIESKNKKINFNCIKPNNDKFRIKELEENLAKNNIIAHQDFKDIELNPKIINDMKYIKKKRKRRTKSEMNIVKELEKNTPKITKLKGRVTNEDKNNNNKNSLHNKNCTDNIIKKVKRIFFGYSLKTVNSLINKYKTDENKNYTLLKIDYKIVDRLKKEVDLILLNMPLKLLLSQNISSKYKAPSDKNKLIIEDLLKDEKDNEVINHIMNLTFMKWIDMFRNKKEVKINGNNIKFEGIDDVLNTIRNKNKEKGYFSNFIYLLYGYEKWFDNKTGRTRKEKDKKDD